jgi:molecular chaperone DnaK
VPFAVDFGTCNTVVARLSPAHDRPESVAVRGFSRRQTWRDPTTGAECSVSVFPSLIHYSAAETLVADQVLGRGLADHEHTLRWVKRQIGQGKTARRGTPQGPKSPPDAGGDLLRALLVQAVDDPSWFASEEFTFTAPVEAFERYRDWIMQVAESMGIRRIRLLDEATACVLGYQGAAHRNDRFLLFDFGGGTLDVAVVTVDLGGQDGPKATQLGQAGADLGGMDIDRWIAEDFMARHGLQGRARTNLEAVALREAEQVKIALSDPRETDANLAVTDTTGAPRRYGTVYTRTCPDCERGRAATPQGSADGCLGCLLLAERFEARVREAIDAAMENASVKAGVRRADIRRVLVTGGTSQLPCVMALLRGIFGDLVEPARPFDAVVTGACRGVVAPVLQHDYSIEAYDPDRREYVFRPLLRIGAEYPTGPGAVKFWLKGPYDGSSRVGLKIFEVSQVRRNAGRVIYDAEGRPEEQTRVATDREHVCLNGDNVTFVGIDPPYSKERDQRRLHASFQVDGNRRLLVTVVDHHAQTTLLRDHPVVRL